MAEELAFVLINPYTLAKSRTGGVISRLLSRGDHELVAARMFAPSQQLVDEYCDTLGPDEKTTHPAINQLIKQYVRENYAPNKKTGERRRVMFLLFRGENAVENLRNNIVGHITRETLAGETIRDTYGDYILDVHGNVKHFEPAVLVVPEKAQAEKSLGVWAKYSERDGGILHDVMHYASGVKPQTTLVLIKPDNFRGPSSRAGQIVELFSRAGLYIIGTRVIRMSVAQAEEFYGPVRKIFEEKLKPQLCQRVRAKLEGDFEFGLPPGVEDALADKLNGLNAQHEFNKIIKFMTGLDPMEVRDDAGRKRAGLQKCLAILYQGPDAVTKIRAILGATDPKKAAAGTVRKEFGQDIMVNTAHASDSEASAERERKIIKVEDNDVKRIVEEFFGKKVGALA